MRINPYLETLVPNEDLSWLASDHAMNEAISITLDSVSLAALFPAPAGSNLVIIPSGTILAKITSGGQTGKYGPHDSTTPATDGRQLTTSLVILARTIQLNTLSGFGGLVDSPAAGLWHGAVYLSKMPKTSGAGSAQQSSGAPQTALKLVQFFA